MINYIDTHVHIPIINGTEDEVIKEAGKKNVNTLINVGYDLNSSKASLELASRYSNVFASIGLHPHYISEEEWKALFAWSVEFLKHKPSRIVAWGETGLDYVRSKIEKKTQQIFFELQIQWAKFNNLPLIIHHREAEEDMLNILSNYAPLKGVMHCYSSTNPVFAEKILSMSLMISFAGNLTYPSSQKLRLIASQIPIKSILLETDAPYLTPVPYRGKENHPGYLPEIYALLADLRQISVGDLSQQLLYNANQLFKIKGERNYGEFR